LHGYKPLISETRIRDAVDVLLTMQNKHSGGFASYEPQRGSELLEYLNAAEVFGRIMVEYDYPECTTAVVTVLSLFQTFSDYRSAEIKKAKEEALKYIRRAQRADGSQTAWVCIALMVAGYPEQAPLKKALTMIMSRQQPNGEWLQEAIEGVFNCSWWV
jgi:lanosterol synthase